MPENVVGSRQPCPILEPIAPLLRAETTSGHVVTGDEVVLRLRLLEQSKIPLHTDTEAYRQPPFLGRWRRVVGGGGSVGDVGAVLDELVDGGDEALEHVGQDRAFLGRERAQHVRHQQTAAGVHLGMT